jgi:hypothetical protein
LTKFRNPKLVEIEPAIAPPNTLGLRSVMFTVESVEDTAARLRAHRAELVGEVGHTRTKTDSATFEALRASSSRWPRNSSEALTAFGDSTSLAKTNFCFSGPRSSADCAAVGTGCP